MFLSTSLNWDAFRVRKEKSHLTDLNSLPDAYFVLETGLE